jgi:uroporphyrinogen-III synthase
MVIREIYYRLLNDVLAAALVAISPTAARAQANTGTKLPLSAAFAVPTTKLLAIGSFTAKAAPNVWRPILPSEMRERPRAYISPGKSTSGTSSRTKAGSCSS